MTDIRTVNDRTIAKPGTVADNRAVPHSHIVTKLGILSYATTRTVHADCAARAYARVLSDGHTRADFRTIANRCRARDYNARIPSSRT